MAAAAPITRASLQRACREARHYTNFSRFAHAGAGNRASPLTAHCAAQQIGSRRRHSVQTNRAGAGKSPASKRECASSPKLGNHPHVLQMQQTTVNKQRTSLEWQKSPGLQTFARITSGSFFRHSVTQSVTVPRRRRTISAAREAQAKGRAGLRAGRGRRETLNRRAADGRLSTTSVRLKAAPLNAGLRHLSRAGWLRHSHSYITKG